MEKVHILKYIQFIKDVLALRKTSGCLKDSRFFQQPADALRLQLPRGGAAGATTGHRPKKR